MRKTLKFLGIIAVAAIAVAAITACPADVNPDGKYWTVTWKLDGGDWPEEAAPPARIEKGEAIDRPSPNPVKAGHAFGGWYTDDTLSARYNFSSPVTGNLTLYAKWDSIYWNITWVLNGGSWTEDSPSEWVGKGAVLDPPESEPSREGYTFLGWYSDADLTVEYDFTEPVTDDLDLYAAWDSISWSVTWHLNGGSWMGDSPPLRVEFDGVLAKPSPDPSKPGNTFLGWRSDAALTAAYTFSATVTGDLDLYADWDPAIFTIGWNLDGGSWAAAAPSTSAEYGAVLVRPSPNPTKSGYTFRGWYANTELTIEYFFNLPVTNNLNLYARWADENAPDTARYLVFTSDIHWSGNSTVPIYEQWMNKLKTQVDHLDYMGFCGDLAIPTESGAPFWTNVTTLMNTAAQYVEDGFITGNGFTATTGVTTKGNLFGLGNHEWYTSGGGNLNANPTGYAQDRLMPNHTVIDEGDYIIYALGPIYTTTDTGCKQQFDLAEINRLSTYLATAPSNVPIFIMAHHPIHGYPGGTPPRITANADSILEMLNDYPNVFFMWGHNHSIPDPYWDTYHVAGDPIITVYGNSPAYTPGPTRTLEFTYFGPGAMRDTEYSGDNGDTGRYVKGKGTLVKIENGVVTLTYYDNNCDPLQGTTYGGVPIINPVTVTVGGPVVPRFTVTFDKNGGTTEASPPAIRVTYPATTVGVLPAPPTRTGYTFTGWNTAPNGSGSPFTETTTVTTGITVYAQWTLKPYAPGDPYIVDLSGQTTRISTAANNDGGSVRLVFPSGFDITSYSKFTITLNFLDSSQNRIATTTSQYLEADLFRNWTGASTRPAAGDRLQTVGPTGVSDNNTANSVNNGFTFTRNTTTFNVNPEGLWVQRAGGNTLRYIEILEIRFHNDP